MSKRPLAFILILALDCFYCGYRLNDEGGIEMMIVWRKYLVFISSIIASYNNHLNKYQEEEVWWGGSGFTIVKFNKFLYKAGTDFHGAFCQFFFTIANAATEAYIKSLSRVIYCYYIIHTNDIYKTREWVSLKLKRIRALRRNFSWIWYIKPLRCMYMTYKNFYNCFWAL